MTKPTIADMIDAIGRLSVFEFCEVMWKLEHSPRFLNIPVPLVYLAHPIAYYDGHVFPASDAPFAPNRRLFVANFEATPNDPRSPYAVSVI